MTHRRMLGVSWALVLALGVAPLEAQQVTSFRRDRAGKTTAPALAVLPDSVVQRRDYRWEGLVIGGAAVGLLGAAVAGGLCGQDETDDASCLPNAFGGFLVGATVGGVLGIFIGRMIPKKE